MAKIINDHQVLSSPSPKEKFIGQPNVLTVDRIYKGGRSGNAGDDLLSKMLGVSNQGGFRYLGSPKSLNLIVMTSSFNDSDWPDHLDKESGILTYYGDNKKPGQLLDSTPRKGNLLLRNIFELIHTRPCQRNLVPPILIFRNTGEYRDVQFLGLAVPGAQDVHPTEDLIATWHLTHGQRFQNYRAILTILNEPQIDLTWIKNIQSGRKLSKSAPMSWVRWVESGKYLPLRAAKTLSYRKRAQQIPSGDDGREIIRTIHDWFIHRPHEFEACASMLARLQDGNFIQFDLTRPTRDGGRDAIGKYRIGEGASAVVVECALEAKCYKLDHSVGVRDTSRLISRLRHRQFGILVTTSFLHEQAYKEIKEDNHPVLIICAADIVNILAKKGIVRIADVINWLTIEFPQMSR